MESAVYYRLKFLELSQLADDQECPAEADMWWAMALTWAGMAFRAEITDHVIAGLVWNVAGSPSAIPPMKGH